MSILDRLRSKKQRGKRTYKEIRYDRILTAQQNMILESSLAANIALKQELKSLRAVLFSQDDLRIELGIDPLPLNNAQPIIGNGEFNAADLIANVLTGLKADNVPGGKNTMKMASDFVRSSSQEINALAAHQLKNMIPKAQEAAQTEVINP